MLVRPTPHPKRRSLVMAVTTAVFVSLAFSINTAAFAEETPTAQVPAEVAPPAEVPTEKTPAAEAAPAEVPAEQSLTDASVSPERPEPPARMELTGTIVEFPTETPPSVLEADGTIVTPEVSFVGGIFLVTETEQTVRLAGIEGAELATGDALTASVSVPDGVRSAVSEQVQADQLTLDARATAELVAEVAAAQDATLVLETFTSVEPAPGNDLAERLPTAQHTIDVAFMRRSGSAGSVPSEADINAEVARLSAYWKRETGGQISGISKPFATQFITVNWDVCGNPLATWDEAAKQFGSTQTWYRNNSSNRHLLVLVDDSDSPQECNGSGLGSVGKNVHSGGTMHAEVDVASPIDWDAVVHHEFGHNISLDHSNARECKTPYIDDAPHNIYAQPQPNTNGCVDREYFDFYDVMSGGMGYGAFSNSRNISSLNVTHRKKLDSLGAGLVQVKLTGTAPQTITLQSAGATSGTRGVEITDPLTGESLLVEYRGTTGSDANSFYSRWAQQPTNPLLFGNGVRVLRTGDTGNNPSILLQRWSGQNRLGYLRAGDQLSSYTDKANIRVVSTNGSQAVISISPSPFTAQQAPTISVTGGGAAWLGKTLKMQTGPSWSPLPQQVTYQWYRGADPIPSADRTSYTLSAADVGKNITLQVTPWRNYTAFTPAASTPIKPSGPKVTRISGMTRFETAIEVSKSSFPGTADVVYLTTGSNFPDALAAAPAATFTGGPLLLVPGQVSQIPQSLLTRVSQLQPKRIVVVGGETAVPKSVVDRIKAAWPKAEVARVSGSDRYATGNAVVRDAFKGRTVPRVLVATGNDFPDALSASAVAGTKGIPVVLVSGKDARVGADTLALLKALGPTQVTIIGGTNAVSAGIQQQFAQLYTTDRLAGSDRFSTSLVVNSASFNGAVSAHYWATGSGFADALSGSVLAGVKRAPLYVVPSTCAPTSVLAEIGTKQVGSVTLIGGLAALSGSVETLSPCG